MKTQTNSQYLFPHKLRLVGWVLIAVSAILLVLCTNVFGLLNSKFDLIDMSVPFPALYSDVFSRAFVEIDGNNDSRNWFTIVDASVFTTFMPSLFLLGALFVCFSKERVEDELICKIREHSLVWSTMFTFFLLIFCTLFFYGIIFLYIKRFIIDLYLIIFYCKFRFELYKINREEVK